MKILSKLFELFNDSTFYSKLRRIAIPIIIQNFIASSLNMVDTMMIGKVGETEIACVGIANQYFFLFNLLITGFCSGCSMFISQFWGKKDEKNIKKVLGVGLIVTVVSGVIFTIIALIIPEKIMLLFNKDPNVIKFGASYLRIVCISYVFTAITFNFAIALRCIEKSKIPMIFSMIALMINTILNYILIFGNFGFKPMGVKGAAIATLIARIIETTLILSYVYLKEPILAGRLNEMFCWTKEFANKIIRNIIPVVLNECCWGTGMVVYSAIYGRIGTKAIASVQICTTVQNLFMVVGIGMANASTVMIGNTIGAGKKEKGKVYAKRFTGLGSILGLSLGIILALSSKNILSIFKVSDKVLHDSLLILYITAVLMTIRVVNVIIITGVLRGGGDAKYPLIVEACTMWLIGVPLAIIGAFVLKLPVYLVVALATAEEITKFFIGLARLISNKWIRNLTTSV
ncbi:MATE family efflux transporter [Clostridium oceanicum]|uniref:MATE family efflux transporter n=1 Tax=Clostridium oceanicum TaxID=1543 RepID=A0ABP3V1R3_9CLOT